MIRTNTSQAAKRLVLKFVLDNIDYRKKCLYLQEIIAMGKENDVWRRALMAFFDTPINSANLKAFSKN